MDNIKSNIKYNFYHKYLKELLDSCSLYELNENKLNSYLQYLSVDKKCSYNQLSLIKIVFKSLYVYGEENYDLKHIDFSRIKLINVKKSHKQQILTIEQEKTLYDFCINNMSSTNLAILLALYTGLRLGELCALRYSDIKERIIYITRNVQRVEGSNKFNDEIDIDNWVSRREAVIPDFLFEYYNTYSSLYKKNDSDHVLTNSDEFIKPRLLQYNIQNTMKRCKIDCSLMVLRNTYQDRCLQSGMDVYTVLSMMGISKVIFELKEDNHISIDNKLAEIKKMAR